MRFNPIPKAANKDKDEKAYNDDEKEDVKREDELYGLLVVPHTPDLLTALMEESFTPLHTSIDLVMILDMSHGITREKLRMLKCAMRLVVFSLGPRDQLSIVRLSTAISAKRLLPLTNVEARPACCPLDHRKACFKGN